MGIRECKVAVKDRLRAPSTAIFYDLKEDNYGDGTLIEGKVESQNWFGGMVIQNFVCYKYEDSDPLSVAFWESRISVYEKITENMQKKQE